MNGEAHARSHADIHSFVPLDHFFYCMVKPNFVYEHCLIRSVTPPIRSTCGFSSLWFDNLSLSARLMKW